MKWEDKTLSQYIERSRLAEWLREIFKAAGTDVQAELDESMQPSTVDVNMSIDPMSP